MKSQIHPNRTSIAPALACLLLGAAAAFAQAPPRDGKENPAPLQPAPRVRNASIPHPLAQGGMPGSPANAAARSTERPGDQIIREVSIKALRDHLAKVADEMIVLEQAVFEGEPEVAAKARERVGKLEAWRKTVESRIREASAPIGIAIQPAYPGYPHNAPGVELGSSGNPGHGPGNRSEGAPPRVDPALPPAPSPSPSPSPTAVRLPDLGAGSDPISGYAAALEQFTRANALAAAGPEFAAEAATGRAATARWIEARIELLRLSVEEAESILALGTEARVQFEKGMISQTDFTEQKRKMIAAEADRKRAIIALGAFQSLKESLAAPPATTANEADGGKPETAEAPAESEAKP